MPSIITPQSNTAVPKVLAQFSAATTDFSDMSEVSFVEGS